MSAGPVPTINQVDESEPEKSRRAVAKMLVDGTARWVDDDADREFDIARQIIGALRTLHSPGNYETASSAVNPCCMTCATREGWPCRTRRELDRFGS